MHKSAVGLVIATPSPTPDPRPLVSALVGLRGLRMCIANKFPDDTDAAGSETTVPEITALEKHTGLVFLLFCFLFSREPAMKAGPENRRGN